MTLTSTPDSSIWTAELCRLSTRRHSRHYVAYRTMSRDMRCNSGSNLELQVGAQMRPVQSRDIVLGASKDCSGSRAADLPVGSGRVGRGVMSSWRAPVLSLRVWLPDRFELSRPTHVQATM